MKTNLSLEQRIFNAHGSQECERLHGIHQLLTNCCRFREEFPFIWARNDNISWGFSWGRLIGLRELFYGQFVNLLQKELKYDVTIPELYPGCAGAEAGQSGFQEYNELNSTVIEVADDGKSCRGSWVCHGMWYTHFNDDNLKRWGANTIERYGADFIYDETDGHWKFQHEQVAPDGISVPFDICNWAYDSYNGIAQRIPEDVKETSRETLESLKKPPVKEGETPPAPHLLPPPRSNEETLHVGYSAIQPVQKTVAPPEPYQTLDENNTYTPLDLRPNPALFRKKPDGNWTPVRT